VYAVCHGLLPSGQQFKPMRIALRIRVFWRLHLNRRSVIRLFEYDGKQGFRSITIPQQETGMVLGHVPLDGIEHRRAFGIQVDEHEEPDVPDRATGQQTDPTVLVLEH
jgi:hypothetical protein